MRSRAKHLAARTWLILLGLCTKSEGAQIVELAVSLPLLAALFVGTYDFGQAFNVKQKLVAATREGARFAANQSTSDLTLARGRSCAPASICAVRDVVDAYLLANNISDCGLASASSAQPNSPQWVWTFTANGCAGGNFVLTIDRGYTFTETVASGGNNVSVTVEATRVTMSYPYPWQFNRLMQFLSPGATYSAVTQIPTSAVVQNLN
ncbi:MAG: pilus assembly protein [Acidobacteria bacterium]|nr:pilus assembly protein [Acidobacteriota bacterium]